MPSIALTYKRDKSTPGTERFAQVSPPVDEQPLVPTLYLKNEAFEGLGSPEVLVVTVEAGE